MHKSLKLAAYIILCFLFFCGCANSGKEKNKHVRQYEIQSEILGREMQLKVYTPEGYSEEDDYPVLYFFPDGGGSVYTVMYQYGMAETADSLIAQGKIHPLIIAAVDIDRSFGINSSETTQEVTTSNDKTFDKGMYEDYFIKEVVPYIDNNYSTVDSRDGRYIGGYSMGGFAALHIALRNQDMFSKAGGHSPSIFTGDFPDVTVSDFLYPTESDRGERDPINLVQKSGAKDMQIFLDVEAGGSDGVKYLYDAAVAAGAEAEYHVMSFSHGRLSCAENMEQYLLFYAGADK